MITIKFMCNKIKHAITFESAEKANQAWAKLVKNPKISLIMGIKEDGTVVFPHTCFAVSVKFDSEKQYTYGCKAYLETGTEVLVNVNGLLKIAKVCDCKKVERNNLKALCNNQRCKWITGVVTRFI